MKIILVALNAKFIHSSLALRSIKKYSECYKDFIFIKEYTINHDENFILGDIFKQNPDIVCFSCYIWNINQINNISKNLKKVLPNIKIILGGPEVSYNSVEYLKENSFVDIIIRGEGEKTFKEITEWILYNKYDISDIKGITYRNEDVIISNDDREALNLDEIPFAYDDLSDMDNKIIYYETQRGCPYNCKYCLSSIEKGVRFLSIERIKSDLRFFLEHKVKQVKFVDRTFNCNRSHANFIWKYIMENDNNITNFHMEIIADIIDDEQLEFLKNARPGLFQFEIGVQSTNELTISEIKRNTYFDKLSYVVKKIKEGKNIHQHLDLIAGLPFEDYNSFKKSFDDVYYLEPEQFQLGFLKLLKGSALKDDASKYGIVYRDTAPYEVLYTKEISYSDMLKLKNIEEVLEVYYNSQKALNTIKYSLKFFKSPFDFYESFAQYWEKNKFFDVQHSKMELFTILYKFAKENIYEKIEVIKDFLKLDIFIGDNVKTLPDWIFIDNSDIFKSRKRLFFEDEKNIKKYMPELENYNSKQISRMCHIESFNYNIFEILNDNKEEKKLKTYILFNYYNKTDIKKGAVFYNILL